MQSSERLIAICNFYRSYQTHLFCTSLMVQWLRLSLPVQVRSLVRELRSHMPCGQKNQNIKQKQYCKEFNKDFKNGPG